MLFAVSLAGLGACLGNPSGSDTDAGVTPDAMPLPDAEPLRPGVSRLAGSGDPGRQDGARNMSTFNNPVNIEADAAGNLFIADFDNGLVRFITPEGFVSTLVDQPDFDRPFGIVFGPDGTLYVQTDRNPQGQGTFETGTIWEVDLDTGEATPLASNLGRPRGLVALPDGRLVMVDPLHHDVQLFDPATGNTTLLAGQRNQAGFVDGAGVAAQFDTPYDLVLDGADAVLVADRGNNRLRRVTLAGEVTTYAGTGTAASTDGTRTDAEFNGPQGLARDDAGNLFVTDSGGYVVRAIDVDGNVTTIAGDGTAGYLDGPPDQAQFYGLEGIAVTGDGALLYIADGNRGDATPFHRIRRMTLTE